MALKKECEGCRKLIRTKNLLKYKGKLICKLCKNKRSTIPSYNLFTVPKSYLPKIRKQKIIPIRRDDEIIINKPNIKDSRLRKQKSIVYGISLSMCERQFLFRKAIGNGLSFDEANKRVKKNVKFLSELVKKLKDKKKSEFEINRKFKEEFAKLIS